MDNYVGFHYHDTNRFSGLQRNLIPKLLVQPEHNEDCGWTTIHGQGLCIRLAQIFKLV